MSWINRHLVRRGWPRPGARSGTPDEAGFSEEALKGLADLDRRAPPIDAYGQPDPPRFRMTARLKPGAAVGGGLVLGPDGAPRPHYHGHRQRLRRRFLDGGYGSMPDYEILELLLFNAIPRMDVKPLAKRLLQTFGDLGGVVAASKPRLLEVDGADDKVFLQLRIVEAFAHRLAQQRVINRSVLSNWADLIEYCRTSMAHGDVEQFRILFLDSTNAVIADELQARGTVNHVPVYPREVAKRALELGAMAVILVHNHPSGDPSPSPGDISMTELVAAACEAIGVQLHDHIIVGAKAEVSFRERGLI